MRTAVLWITSFFNIGSLAAMVAGILLHSGRGGGLSDMFGGASGAALGSAAAEKNLTRITMLFTMVWIFTTIGLGLLLTT